MHDYVQTLHEGSTAGCPQQQKSWKGLKWMMLRRKKASSFHKSAGGE